MGDIFADLGTFLQQHETDAVDAAVAPVRADLATANEGISDRDTIIEGLRQRIAELEAGPTPAPEPAPLLIGGLLRGTGTGDSADFPRPKWDVIRTYNIGDALEALAKGKASRVATSFGRFLGGPGWRNEAAKISALRDQLASIPDNIEHWVGDTHEFDNPEKYGTNVAAYLADAAVFASVVREVNAGRTHALKIFRCCMAYSISKPERNIDAFFVSDAENYDIYGPDVYSYKQIDQVVGKAALYGKPLFIPEMGPLNAVPQVDTAETGGSILDYMQKALATWSAPAVDCRGVCWFDLKGAGADLDKYSKSRAFWFGRVAA